MSKKWVCFFSQTGSEIFNISERLGIEPDLIVTNRIDENDNCDCGNINDNFLDKFWSKIVFIDKKPSLEQYKLLINEYKEIFDNCFITLHGYLRIIPEQLCSQFKIYNLHPGLITKYPELKGFNPQEKAFNLKLPTSGSVIHKVIPEVDSGEILDSIEVDIKDKNLDEIYQLLHTNSTELWLRFLNQVFYNDNN